MRVKNQGFTLVELVLVIAILGILSVMALPSMFNISLTTARTNSMNAVAAAVKTGIALYAVNQLAQGHTLTYPAVLGTAVGAPAPAGTLASGATPLFNGVLQNGVTSQWIKLASGTCYVYDRDGSGNVSSGDIYFQYTPATGQFLQVTTCS
jgi:prepilin-type N-terminal cleavage/methylation domain-containing protein